MAPRSVPSATAGCVAAASSSSSLPPQPATPSATSAAKVRPARRNLLLMTLPRFVGCRSSGTLTNSDALGWVFCSEPLASLHEMLHHQLPWYVGGPVLGLCVVALRLLLNGRLGVTGAYTDVIENVGRRSLAFDWRGWFFVGLIAGGAAFALIAGGPDFHGYGWLTDTFHGSAQIVIAPVLLVAGVLIGYGSKTRRRLHLGQRPQRDLDALAGEPRRHRDLLRDRRSPSASSSRR